MKKKHRKKRATAKVARAILDRVEKHPEQLETSAMGAPESSESAAAAPGANKVWRWARRVVLGYDRRP